MGDLASLSNDFADIEYLNHRANDPHLHDGRGHTIQDDYFQGYEAAEQYAYDVLTGRIKTGRQTKAAVKRFINDLDRDDLEMRTEEVERVIAFTNLLCHVKGVLVGKPLYLLPWMIFVFANVFGFYYTKGAKQGERRFQRAFTMVARGNAKSTLLSAIALFSLAYNVNGAPYACSAARTAKQSRICFADAAIMAKKAHPEIRTLFKVRANDIQCPSTSGLFEPVSSDAEGLDGKRISGVGIIDELHAHRDMSVYNAIRTGVTASRNPLIFMISTAGRASVESPAMVQQRHGREVLANIVEDDSYFYLEFSIDDEDDWEDESCWIKANPSLNHAVSIETLKNERNGCRSNATLRADFITKYCNLFYTAAENTYIDLHEFQKGARPLDLSDYAGREACLGLDLAMKSDLCSLALVFANDEGGVDIFTRNYLPRGILNRVPASLAEKYRNLEGENLTLTHGEITDFEYIVQDILRYTNDFTINAICYDTASGGAIFAQNMMRDHGLQMLDVKQGFGLSDQAKELEALVKGEKVHYQETDKVLEWCISNAVYTEGQFQDWKVHKQKDAPYEKVDSVIATLIAMKMVELKGQEVSAYENPNFYAF